MWIEQKWQDKRKNLKNTPPKKEKKNRKVKKTQLREYFVVADFVSDVKQKKNIQKWNSFKK